MPVVFSPEAIEQGRVPVAGAHYDAALDAMKFLDNRDIFREQSAEQYMIFGSVPLGQATVGSDLDVALVNPNQEAGPLTLPTEGLGAALRRTIYERHSVPTEIHVIPSGSYGPVGHPIDPLLVDHLLEAQNNQSFSRNFPVEAYRDYGSENLSNDVIKRLIANYAGRKLTYFTEADIQFTGEPDLKAFQRALELPVAIGRKLLRLHREDDPHISTPIAATGELALRLATRSSLPLDVYRAADNLTSPETVQSPFEVVSGSIRNLTGSDRFSDVPLYQQDILAVDELIHAKQEYDELLDMTLRTKNVPRYRERLRANYLPVLRLAQTTARLCLRYYVNDLYGSSDDLPKTLTDLQRQAAKLIEKNLAYAWEY